MSSQEGVLNSLVSKVWLGQVVHTVYRTACVQQIQHTAFYLLSFLRARVLLETTFNYPYNSRDLWSLSYFAWALGGLSISDSSSHVISRDEPCENGMSRTAVQPVL